MESNGTMNTMVLGARSIMSSLRSCLLASPDGLWLIVSLTPPCTHYHLLPSTLVWDLGKDAGKVGTRNVCPAHLGVRCRCGQLYLGLVVP